MRQGRRRKKQRRRRKKQRKKRRYNETTGRRRLGGDGRGRKIDISFLMPTETSAQ